MPEAKGLLFSADVLQRMLGGLCFKMNDKMCFGIEKERLVVRLNPAKYEEVIEMDAYKPMDFTGKIMKGYVFVDADVLKQTKRTGILD